MTDAPQITHAAGCWQWSREHYWCALREIERLRERAEKAEAALAEALKDAPASGRTLGRALANKGFAEATARAEKAEAALAEAQIHHELATGRAVQAERDRDEARRYAEDNLTIARQDGHHDGYRDGCIASQAQIDRIERETMERCARVADQWATDEQRQFGNGGPAAAIRAMRSEA